MDTSKLLLGTLAGAVAAFITGYLIFGLALSGYMAENTSATNEPNILWIALGHVVIAALITYICLQWAGIKTAVSGAKAGALIAFLAALGINWILLGTTNMFTGGVAATLVDALGTAVIWAVGGAAIGWVLGRGGD